MKLKYYLRGLGIGIVVTAIIMSITNKPQELTDAQIKMRALELGMVEESVLADLQAKEENADADTIEDILNQHEEDKSKTEQQESPAVENDAEDVEEVDVEKEDAATESQEEINAEQEDVTSESKEEINAEQEDVTSESKEEVNAEKEDATAENKEEIKTEDAVTDNNINDEVIESFVIIKIERGNGSEVVSRRLFEAGLVESAVEYNQFLVTNGYDRRLSVGNHEIPSTATYEEMARILCGMK